MAALTAGLTAGSIIAGKIGKDIDYPWMQGTYQVVDGVAKQIGGIQTLDKGHKLPGQKMIDATISAVNTALKGLGIYGRKGATYATQPIGVVAGDRPGAVKGGFYTGFEADKSKVVKDKKGKEKFLGGVRQDSTGFGSLDQAIEKAVENQVQSIHDSGGAAVKEIINAAGGAHGFAAATAEASGLDIAVPSKFKASNFWTKLSKGLKIAAVASGGYDLANAVSNISAAATAANTSGATVASFGPAALEGGATITENVINGANAITGIVNNSGGVFDNGTGFDSTNSINNGGFDLNTDAPVDANTNDSDNAILTAALAIPNALDSPADVSTNDGTTTATADSPADTKTDPKDEEEGVFTKYLAEILGVGGTVISAWLQSRSGDKAARALADAQLKAAMTQSDTPDKVIEETQRQFDTNRADLLKAQDESVAILDDAGEKAIGFLDIGKEEAHKHLGVYEEVGKESLGTLNKLLNSEENVTENFEKLSPGFNFRKGQGEQALERYQSSKGDLLSGRGVKEALRFNSNFASEEFGNYINRLLGLAGAGQNASSALAGIDVATNADKANITTGTAGNIANVKTGTATNISNANTANTNAISSLMLNQSNIDANATINAANANSDARINTTNAITGGISNSVNSIIAMQQQNRLLDALGA
jgi:hypothetical protein